MAKRPSTTDMTNEEREQLASRFRTVVEAVGTHADAAQIAKCSVRQLRQYLAGHAAPSFLVAGRLAMHTRHSLDWILSGDGSPMREEFGEEKRASDSVFNEGEWNYRALKQIHALLTELYRPLPHWNEELDDTLGGALLDVVWNRLPKKQWDQGLAIALLSHRQAAAAIRNEPIPEDDSDTEANGSK